MGHSAFLLGLALGLMQAQAAAALENVTLAAGTLKNVTFNYTLNDMDTMLVYTPSTVASATIGWDNTYSNSAKPATSSDSVYGQGNSSHYTSLGGAYIDLSFYGTGVYYFGSTASGNDLRLTVDGVNYDFTPTANNPLLAYREVSAGYHSATLSLNSNNGNLTLDSVNVQTQAAFEVSSFSAASVTEELFLTGSNATGASSGPNALYTYSGAWAQSWTIGGDGDTQALYYPVLVGQVGSSFTVDIPANTSYFSIEGASQPTVSYYTVSLSPAPPQGGSANSTYTATREYTNPVNYFISPLDPAENYTLTFTVAGIATINGPIGIHSMSFYSSIQAANTTNTTDSTSSTTGTTTTGSSSGENGGSNTGSSSSNSSSGSGGKSTNAGAIAGGVVGGLVVVAVIVGFGVWYMNRRHERKRGAPRTFEADNGAFEIDEEPDAAVDQPYLSPPYAPPSLPAMAESRDSSLGLVINSHSQDQTTPVSTVARSKSASAAMLARGAGFTSLEQELDAGRLPDTIPPSYDPTWAVSDRDSTDYALSDPGAGPSRLSRALSDPSEVESVDGLATAERVPVVAASTTPSTGAGTPGA